MAMVVDDDVAVTATHLVTRRPATVSVPLAELDHTVNDVCIAIHLPDNKRINIGLRVVTFNSQQMAATLHALLLLFF